VSKTDNLLTLLDDYQMIEVNSDTNSNQFGVIKSFKMDYTDPKTGKKITTPSMVNSQCDHDNWKIHVLVDGHTNVFSYNNTDGVINRKLIGTPTSS